MTSFVYDSHIKCSFSEHRITRKKSGDGFVELYYAQTAELKDTIPAIQSNLTDSEQERAAKFSFEHDRNTFILCHAFTRRFLSKHLSLDPLEIVILPDKNRKPQLPGPELHFNISHTRHAFAIAISSHLPVGVDLEEKNLRGNYDPVIRRVFSPREQEFIIHDNERKEENFLALWTRKEALLKAIGTGIVVDLPSIEVSEEMNHVNSALFDMNKGLNLDGDVHIYTRIMEKEVLSLATFGKPTVRMEKISRELADTELG